MRNLLLAIGLLTTLVSPTANAASSPKLTVRNSAIMVTDQRSTGSETQIVLGGLEASLQFFLFPKLSLGIGYAVAFDATNQGILIHGADFAVRYYVWGSGTRVTTGDPWVQRTSRSRFAAYVGAFAAQRTFNTPPDIDGLARDSVGTVYAGPLFGGDFRLSEHFDFNVELSVSLIATGDGENTPRVFANTLAVGLGYAF